MQEIHLKFNNIGGWKRKWKHTHTQYLLNNQKTQAELALLILDKKISEQRKLPQTNKTLRNDKRINPPRRDYNLICDTQNNRASKYVKQKFKDERRNRQFHNYNLGLQHCFQQLIELVHANQQEYRNSEKYNQPTGSK